MKINYSLNVSAKTSIGKVKKNNEDSYGINTDLNLYILSDGMGGHRGGDIASRIAVDTVKDAYKFYFENDISPLEAESDVLDINARRLLSSIKSANLEIFNKALHNQNLKGMGTTIVALLIDPLKMLAYIGHVGDSRIYSISEDRMNQITIDHSLVYEYLKKGWLTKQEIANHPLKNILNRALGVDEDVEIDIITRKINNGETYLLCSDGLTNMLSDQEILEIIKDKSISLEEKNQTLIDVGNNKGGIDNLTAILVEFLPN